jgi:uncharacterized Fe-S cluster protein YjdI
VKRYEGERIEVTYDTARCLHAAESVRGLPAVFDTSKRPWVAPDGAGAEAIAAVILPEGGPVLLEGAVGVRTALTDQLTHPLS